MRVIPLHALRAIALHAQSLHAPNQSLAAPTQDDIYKIVNQLGCIQIDTLQMVRHSHDLVLWSRLGSYDPGEL